MKVPPFLYEPKKRSLRGVGEVIGHLPVPGAEATLPMHRVPALQWSTWVRLAFVEQGKDWRSLNRLRVQDGRLQDFVLVSEPSWRATVLGVCPWDEPSGTVAGRSGPTNGAFSVADPRIEGHPRSVQLGLRAWDEPAGVVTGQCAVGQGPHAIADPRIVAPRADHLYRIRPIESAASERGITVGDPRPNFACGGRRSAYQTAGHYGVVPWEVASGAITASGQSDNGRWSVADPRLASGASLPSAGDRLITVIRALDGTWHRPFTTLELAALQSLVDPEEALELDGLSDQAWRERIGNAVPPAAAEAIASVMGRTLLLAWAGESFMLSNEPIWVRPMAVAAAVNLRSATSQDG